VTPHPALPPSSFFCCRAGLPPQVGLGFKPQHFDSLLADATPPAFIEVHAENYLGAGGLPHAQLRELHARMPLSVHGVGLSIGGATPPDEAHLDRLAMLLERHQPESFSEHLAWSTHDGRFYNDLLPLRYDEATLRRVCAHLDRVQSRLGRRILLENPSSYFEFPGSELSEAEFLAQVVARSGCGLLLDVNNLYVSCHNHGQDPRAALDRLPLHAIGEVHLAGHAHDIDDWGRALLVDDHGSRVCAAVWSLYEELLGRTGPLPTLVEWDTDVPEYAELRGEALEAQALIEQSAATRIGCTLEEEAA
jgi:uncharacterized protein (UPF0276 family)